MHRKERFTGCRIALALAALMGADAQANEREQCLLLAIQSATGFTTVAELRTLCEEPQEALTPAMTTETVEAVTDAAAEAAQVQGAVEERLALQRYSRDNPFTLTALRPNYILPIVYSKHPNAEPFGETSLEWDNIEAQFQLSLEVLIAQGLFGDNGHLSVGYTAHSFWQAYSGEASAPFRETIHEPELIFTLENDWTLFGFHNVANQLILNHQSNGRGGQLSRSWNRVMLNIILERENLALSLRPWYRLPEAEKDYPADTSGDDNPDIERYLGHFEFIGAWEHDRNVFSLMLRNNLRDDNKGAVEFGWSFPLTGRVKGYVKYFNGYGETLIDYNESMESLGVGFLITDWL